VADTARRRPPAAGKGRPKGATNKATREFKDAARQFLESAAYRTAAERRMVAGKAPHLELFFFQHAYGKPTDTTDLSGSVSITVTRPW
jgi:hypothetical protein